MLEDQEAGPRRRGRRRAGYVMLELTAEDRKKLEGLRDRLESALGVRIGLAGALRSLLRKSAETQIQ